MAPKKSEANQKTPGQRVAGLGLEEKICGPKASLAVLRKRPESIIRLYLVKEAMPAIKELVKYCVAQRLAYHLVTHEELSAISKSEHHEGVCILVKTAKPTELTSWLDQNLHEKSLIVILDGVLNPHNIGAILRTSAHFGVQAVISAQKARLTPAAVRVAEGGAESVPFFPTEDMATVLKQLAKKKVQLIGLDGQAKTNLYQAKLSGAVALLLGSEKSGPSTLSKKSCQQWVAIPGTGEIESLNVSTSAAIALSECWRQRL